MQFFRLLHRPTKSEGDVPTLLSQPGSGVIAPVFVPLKVSLPSLDHILELYTDSDRSPMSLHPVDKLSPRITELESQLARLQDEQSTLEQDLVDYRADLLNTRTELYAEMLKTARQQQKAMDDFRTIQKLEARHQRFCSLFVDIGIPPSTVDLVCQFIQSGNASPDDVLVDAIKDASNDRNTLLASRLKPIPGGERTPEHYRSALNLTLSIRKELKSQKKRSKFWKKLAQEDGRHATTLTPSPSDMSSIHQDLSPQRQDALDALIARRRAARYPENPEGDVFGGQRRESALDTLASSLASRPRRSIQDALRLSTSLSSSSASSASTTYLSYLSGLSRIPRDSAAETPSIPSRLPSPLSTSLRRSSRSSSQSIVLGSINVNVSRSSSIGPIDPILTEEAEQNPETVPTSTMTLSQNLLQNVGRASQGHGHRRLPSMASRRSARSTRNSFRLSAFSPIRAFRAAVQEVPGNSTSDAPAFRTPDMRLSDLEPSSDTPASSDLSEDGTSFNDTPSEAQFSPTDAQVASTPLDLVSCKPLATSTCTHDTRFREHLDTYAHVLDASISMSASASESESESESNAHADKHEHVGTGTMALGESKDSLFTASASSLTANDTPAPTTPRSPKTSVGRSMLPVLAKHLRRLSLSSSSAGSSDRERLVDKLRGLRSLSRSRSPPAWQGSPARSESSRSGSESEHVSPVKGSGIPVLQRRMTIRARRTSVRKI